MRVALAAVALVAAVQAPPAPGFSITFDGGIFSGATLVVKPFNASYTNLYIASRRDPRVNRLDLASMSGPGIPQLTFGVPAKVGTYAFDHTDEDDPNRHPYLRLYLHTEQWTAANGYRFDLQHVDVTITR